MAAFLKLIPISFVITQVGASFSVFFFFFVFFVLQDTGMCSVIFVLPCVCMLSVLLYTYITCYIIQPFITSFVII